MGRLIDALRHSRDKKKGCVDALRGALGATSVTRKGPRKPWRQGLVRLGGAPDLARGRSGAQGGRARVPLQARTGPKKGRK